MSILIMKRCARFLALAILATPAAAFAAGDEAICAPRPVEDVCPANGAVFAMGVRQRPIPTRRGPTWPLHVGVGILLPFCLGFAGVSGWRRAGRPLPIE